MSKKGTILVAGATGQQGGAATRHLLASGWQVRAMTRDARSAKAQALAASGAQVVEADLFDPAGLKEVAAGAYGVFSVQNFWLPEVGVAGEVQQGKNLADAAAASGVRHFVYSSVGGAERDTGLSHFESKWQIEQHITALNLPATVIRPVYFMENLFWARPAILNGVWTGIGLRPGVTVQLIAVDDIGGLVAQAFENPAEHVGRATEIAGDELSEAQIVETLSRVIGRPVALQPQGNTWGDEEGERMLRWFNESGYTADIPALRKQYPRLQSLESWLRVTGWENAQPEPLPEGAWSG